MRCSTCGGNHGYQGCEEAMICVNCGGNHSAASKSCPKFVEIQSVIKVKTVEKISYADALKSVEARKVAPPVSNNLLPSSGVDSSRSYAQSLSSSIPQIPMQSGVTQREEMDVSPLLDSEGLSRTQSQKMNLEQVPVWDTLVVIFYKVLVLSREKKLFNNGRKKVVSRLVELIQQVLPSVKIDLEDLIKRLDFANIEGNFGGYIHTQ